MKLQHPKVSECANPECKAEFRRLGEGKLYLQPPHKPGIRGHRQTAAWLCEHCSRKFNLRFEAEQSVFILQRKAAA